MGDSISNDGTGPVHVGTLRWWAENNDDKAAILSYLETSEYTNHFQPDDEQIWSFDDKYTFPLQRVSDRLRNDRDVVLAAIRWTAKVVPFGDEKFEDMLLERDGCPGDLSPLKFASPSIMYDRQVVMEHVTKMKDFRSILYWKEYEGSFINDDRTIMLALSQNTPQAMAPWFYPVLQFASDRLKDDKGFVLEIFDHIGVVHDIADGNTPLQYVSGRLQDDAEVVLKAMEMNEYAFQYASPRLKNDRGFVMQALQHQRGYNSDAYCLANLLPQTYGNDRDVVLQLVSKSGWNLGHSLLNPRFLSDRDIVFAAVRDDCVALRWADSRLKRDREIVLAAVRECGSALQWAEGSAVDDEKIVLEAILSLAKFSASNVASNLAYASERLKNDKPFVLVAMHYDGIGYQYASERLKRDWQIAMTAVAQCDSAIFSLPEQFRTKKEFALTCISNHEPFLDSRSGKRLLQVVGFNNDREVIRVAIEKDWRSIMHASDDLQLDPEMLMLALSHNKSLYPDGPPRIEYKTAFAKPFHRLREMNETLLLQNDRFLDVLFGDYNCQSIKKKLRIPLLGESNYTAPKSKRCKPSPTFDTDAWCRVQWERVWLVAKLNPVHQPSGKSNLPADVQRNIVEFAGVQKTTQLCSDVKKLSPVINRFSELGLVIPSKE